jgi:beta-lactamase regulating signal transducer with metallopeptidase domain
MSRLLEIGLSNAAMATLLAVLAAGLCRLYRRPAVAHGLWLVVLLKLVTPPLVPVHLPWFDSREPSAPPAASTLPPVLLVSGFLPDGDIPVAGQILDTAALPVALPIDHSADVPASGPSLAFWCWLVILVWLAGSACALVRVARSVLRFRRLLRFAYKADPDLQGLAGKLARELGLTGHPDVWLVPTNISPMLWAFGGRPRLLLPAQLLERLDHEQLRTILLHELAHCRRRDHWVRMLEMVVLVLYWWHPVVWWARAELREAEEQCCDAWVVGALNGAGRTYALALLETVAFLSRARLPLPASASGIGQVFHLRRRLTMILNGPQRRSLTVAGCVALAGFAFLVLPLVPVLAQEPEKKAVPARSGIVLELDGDLEVLVGDDGSSDQEAVELLKRALKLLAERKRVAGKPVPEPAKLDEIKKAHDQVQALAAEVEQRRAELQAMEAKLQHAKAHLAGLEGKPAIKVGHPIELQFKVQPDGALKLGEHKTKVIGVAPAPILRMLDGKNIFYKVETAGTPVKKGQPEELKSRLDRLLREVEELRREIEHSHGTKPQEK